MPSLSLSESSPATYAADALLVPIIPSGDGVRLAAAGLLPAPLEDALLAALAAVGARAKPGETLRLPAPGGFSASSIITVGLAPDQANHGDPTAPSGTEALRRAAGQAVRAAAGCKSVALAFASSSAPTVAAVAEGALLGAYRFDKLQTKPKPALPSQIVVTAPKISPTLKTAVDSAIILAEACASVCDLVNTPANQLWPEQFALTATNLAKGTGLKVTVMDESALAKAGLGGILGVGQGSARPPRLVRLTWSPAKAKANVALIGKGITFDSGGLSLKTPKGMETMKCDMAGAATVLGAVLALARLKTPISVSAYLALAENMPSATAQRPGDVVTICDGTTVEVLNTDAEGRLVLADALVQARQAKPDAMVDIATLTGTQIAALGERIGAVMGSDSVCQELTTAAAATGEPLWQMPLPAALAKALESNVADLKNIGGPEAGMLTAGLFLKHFVGDIPWAHLDIAGPAFNSGDAFDYTPVGGTAWGLRTLVAWCQARAAQT